MGNFLNSPESPETRKLKQRFEIRGKQDENLYKIAKLFITEWYSHSGRVPAVLQKKFKECLSRVDQDHQALIDYVQHYLRDDEINEVFVNKKLERQIAVLQNQLTISKNEKLIQKEQYEGIIKRFKKDFYEERRDADKRYSELQQQLQETEDQRLQSYTQNINNVSYSNMENVYGKIQQLEDKVKTKNDFIQYLQQQYSDCLRHNKELMGKQDTLSNDVITIQVENEKRKTRELQHIQRLEEKKLQSIQRDYEKKISNLEAMLAECEQRLHNQYQQNKILQEQLSKSKVEFEDAWRKLEKNFISRGVLIDNLDQKLALTIEERDMFKNEIFNLHHQIEKLKSEIIQFTIAQQGVTGGDNIRSEEQGSLVQNEDEDALIRESLKQIENIFENTNFLENKVLEFFGTKEDKTFLHLQELLVRNIVKLDNVESGGNINIRNRKKEAIRYVQNVLNKLKEDKAPVVFLKS